MSSGEAAMVREISEWLERLKLGQYAKSFADNDVDRDLLFELSEDDLIELGVTSLGHRKRLFKEIAVLRTLKDTFSQDEYFAELQKLLLEMAIIEDQLAAEGDTP